MSKIHVTDAQTGDPYELNLAEDAHGLVIDVKGVDQHLILHVSNDSLRVFVGSERGDTVSDPEISIPLKEETGAGQEV